MGSFSWRRIILSTALGSMVVAGSCEREPATTQSQLPPEAIADVPLIEKSSPIKAEPEGYREYAMLARTLGDPLLTTYDVSTAQPSMDEVYAAANSKLMEYQEIIASGRPRVAALADEARSAQIDFLAAHRRLETADDGTGGALLLCLGVIAGNPAVAFSGLQGAIAASDTQGVLTRDYSSAFQRNRGAQLSLAALAPTFAGPEVSQSLFAIDMDESWGGLTWPWDWFTVQNNSGRDLTDCVLEVVLTGASGEKRRNVHYVSRWQKNQPLIARYGIGVSVGREELGRQTVYGLKSVEVSVWSKECRAERISYVYEGAERDADVQRLIDGKLMVRWQLYDGGFLNVVPTMAMTLDGVNAIPAHSVKMSFRRGADTLNHEWTGQSWSRGQNRVFQPNPRLPWFPEEIVLSIAFGDTSYRWERTIDTRDAAKQLEPRSR